MGGSFAGIRYALEAGERRKCGGADEWQCPQISNSEKCVGKRIVRGGSLRLGRWEAGVQSNNPFRELAAGTAKSAKWPVNQGQALHAVWSPLRPTGQLRRSKSLPTVTPSLTAVGDGFRSPNENMTDTANRQFWQNPPALRFMVAVRGRPLGLPSLSLLLGLRTRSQPPPICFAAKRWLFYPRGLF